MLMEMDTKEKIQEKAFTRMSEVLRYEGMRSSTHVEGLILTINTG